MCGKTVVILRKYECGCVCWRDCPTQVAICSNPCLPWHSLTPSDPRIPPLYPEKTLLKCSTVSTVTIHPHKPLTAPLPKARLFTKTKLSVHVSAERQSSRAGGLRLTVRHPSPPCIPRAGSRQASLAHTGHRGRGASLDFRNAKHSPCVRAGTQLCYANFKLWVKNLLAQISLSTRALAQICSYIDKG